MESNCFIGKKDCIKAPIIPILRLNKIIGFSWIFLADLKP